MNNIPEFKSQDSLFIWLIHRIAEVFKDHAILKGGMMLRLLDCPRSTNDIDYTFVPYNSKKEIVKSLLEIAQKIPNSKVSHNINSKAVRIQISVGEYNVQIEANTSKSCKSIPISTSSMAGKFNINAKIIRVMSFDVALANKLAAWNERRLLRDLYDIYYLYRFVGEKPDMDTLLSRLSKVESRLPKLKMKTMDLDYFISELKEELVKITEERIEEELHPLLNNDELAGLDIKIKTAINELISTMSSP